MKCHITCLPIALFYKLLNTLVLCQATAEQLPSGGPRREVNVNAPKGTVREVSISFPSAATQLDVPGSIGSEGQQGQ
jgi:hypothetical protein